MFKVLLIINKYIQKPSQNDFHFEMALFYSIINKHVIRFELLCTKIRLPKFRDEFFLKEKVSRISFLILKFLFSIQFFQLINWKNHSN